MAVEDLFAIVKNSFCELMRMRMRGSTMELISPYSTLNNKFVSVFVKETPTGIVVSDGGWIESGYYEVAVSEESEDIVKRVANQYAVNLGVSLLTERSPNTNYYKICETPAQLPSVVFDMASFINGMVNACILQYRDEKEESEKETFRRSANDFLSANYPKAVQFRRALDDLPNVRFNAIIQRSTKLVLVNYVTGSTPYYFDAALRTAIVSFELSERSKYNPMTGRVAIINDQAAGYSLQRSETIIGLLTEHSSREPIPWSKREALLDYV